MSTTLSIRSVTDALIEEVKGNTIKVNILIDAPHGLEEDMLEESIESYEEWLNRDLTDTERELLANWKPDFIPEYETIDYFRIIHFLLTGYQESTTGEFPLNFLLGKRIEMGEMGWGTASFYTSKDVKDIDQAISAITDDELRKRFETDVLNSPRFKSDGWRGDDVEAISKDFTYLKTVIRSFSERNLGMFIGLV